MQPVPIFYVVAAAVGLIVGLVVQLLTGAWWWVPPIVLVVGGWAFFFSTVWWGRSVHSAPLREELTLVLRPEQGRTMRRDREERLLLDSAIPFYVPAEEGNLGWRADGWEHGGDGVEAITLKFATAEQLAAERTRGETPLPHRMLTVYSGVNEEIARARLFSLYTEHVLDDTTPATCNTGALGAESRHDAYMRRVDEWYAHAATLAWQPITFTVDGEARAGVGVQGDGYLLATCVVGGLTLCVLDTGDPPCMLQLSRVSDREAAVAQFVSW